MPVTTAALLTLLAIGVTSAIVHAGGLVGDQALIELQTRDVLSLHPPLTGPYSRYGWAHPGPAMFVLMAPVYFVLDASGTSLMLAAAALNTAFGVACVAVVERTHRRAALGVFALLLIILVFADESILAVPWNPRATVVPLLLLVVASTLASLGDDVSAGVVVIVAPFVLSAHVGIGVAVLPMVAFGLGTWWYQSRRWPPGWSLRCLALLSLPMVADVVIDWPGNPGRLVRFALSDDSPQLGVRAAARFVLRSSSPEFLLRDRYDGFVGFVTPMQPLGLVPGALIVALAVVSWRGATPTTKHAARMLLAGFIGTAISISNIRGVPFEYLLLPLPVFATCGWTLVVADVWMRNGGRLLPHRRRLRAGAVAVVVALAAAASVSEIGRTEGDQDVWAIVDEAATATADAHTGGPVILRADVGDPFALILYFGGLMNELDRREVDVRVLPGTAEIVGDARNGDIATAPQITLSVLPADAALPDRGTTIFTASTASGDLVRLQLAPAG